MDAPESLLAIVANAATQHREDIDQAVACAFREWQDDPERSEFVEQLERQAIREHIHRYRHHMNTAIRREAGEFGGPAKVTLSEGAANAVAAECWLNSYSIGGRSIGSIFGKELPALAKQEREKADGAAFNARLCDALLPLVPEEKSVAQVVTEAKFRKLFKELRRGKRKRQLARS